MISSNVHYHGCMNEPSHCWIPKKYTALKYREVKNSHGLCHEKCSGESDLSLGARAGLVYVGLQAFDVVH